MNLSCIRLIPACILLALPGAALSAEVSVDATSIVRMEQRAPQGYAKQDIAPFTQFLGLDVDKLADGNLSLHVYGWGRGDIRDKDYYFKDRYAGSLTYGYLQYRFNKSSDARLGRFFIHEGIVNEQVDGLSLRTELPLGFGLSTFGGANVHTQKLLNEKSDGKGEAIAGGRLNYRYKGMLELGASGVYETKAPVLTSVQLDGSPRYANGNRRLVGGDVWFSPIKQVELMGHSSYNTETKSVAEHTYLLNIKPMQHLTVTGEFNEHRERSFAYSSLKFSESALNPAEKSRSFGGSASYEISKALEVSADYKHYQRDIGKADRYGADAKFSFLNNSVRSGLGYHYLHAGKEFVISGLNNASASYHELRAYVLHDTKTYFAAVDVLDYLFKEKIYNEKHAWEAMASLGYHLTPDLAVSGDLSYGRNIEFTQETKGLVRLTYNMTFDSKGGMK